LARHGWRVYQLGLAGDGEGSVARLNGVVLLRWRRPRYRGRRIFRYLQAYGGFLIWARRMLARLGRRRPIRVVQVNNLPNFMVWCASGVRKRGGRVLLDMHDPEPELFASKWGARPGASAVRRGLERIERAAARAADATVCVHEPMRALLERRGTGGGGLRVVINAPDAALFPRLAPRRARPGLIYHGTVAHRMGLEVVIDAVAALAAGGRDVRLAIIGDGDAVADLQRRSAACGVADRVSIPGRRFRLEEMLPMFREAGVGIVPVRRDVFTDLMLPTKLLEYARLGIATAVTWTPTIGHYFPEDTVYFIREFTVAGVAATLARIVDAPADAATRAGRAQALPIARPWQDLEEDYVALIEAVAG